jgi:hypothetical protein
VSTCTDNIRISFVCVYVCVCVCVCVYIYIYIYIYEIHAVDEDTEKIQNSIAERECVKYQYTDVLNNFKSETYNEIINLNQNTQMSVILQLMVPLY